MKFIKNDVALYVIFFYHFYGGYFISIFCTTVQVQHYYVIYNKVIDKDEVHLISTGKLASKLPYSPRYETNTSLISVIKPISNFRKCGRMN